ncbi:MAG: replication restart DNA helicase PriA [Cyanobacteria bacterium SID2]|nr:replication restart DNA helicase PriA [Cyanobacteria bacterium SID2]MBP0003539.1 replication restart DNA helicase PriA [Cyanobacteria bacterium SBC]
MIPISTPHTVRCPNCGRLGERHYLAESKILRTQCHHCDYLMVTCATTGRVIEAYSPGLYAQAIVR